MLHAGSSLLTRMLVGIQSFLLLVVGIFTGALFDAGHFRSLLIIGNFLVVLGMMLTR
jgi:hypothetical protein